MALPIINLSVVPLFPAHVVEDGPIVITKSGATYTFGWDPSRLYSNPAPSDPSLIQVVGFNPVAGISERYPLSAIQGGFQITAAQISDSSTSGRGVLTGTAAAGRTALGLGDIVTLNAGAGLTASGGNLVIANSGVSAGSYPNANITIGADGRITAATSGSGAGDVVGPASATDNAAVRFDTTTGKLVQNSALLIADTTGSLSRSGGGGIPVQGTNTNDAAGAGYVGEVVQAARLAGSAIVLTSNSVADVTSISLSAGDWDVQGQVAFSFAGTTTYTQALSWTSTTSATLPSADSIAAPFHRVDVSSHAPGSIDLPVPTGTGRLTLSSTTTVYLSCRATFATAGLNAYGFIWARRAR